MLKAFGLLSCRVGLVVRENVLDAKSETFLPDLTQVLRRVFAFFRLECGERGMRDVSGFYVARKCVNKCYGNLARCQLFHEKLKVSAMCLEGFGLVETRSNVQWYCLFYGSRLGIFVVVWCPRRLQRPGHWLISEWL